MTMLKVVFGTWKKNMICAFQFKRLVMLLPLTKVKLFERCVCLEVGDNVPAGCVALGYPMCTFM